MLLAAALATLTFVPPGTVPVGRLTARPIGIRAVDSAEPPFDAEPFDADSVELPPDFECSEGKIVTELVETGNVALPDRFMMAVRAIRGDFSPPEGSEDTEHMEDQLTAALLNFPTTVTLKVVTRPLADVEEANLFLTEINLLVSTLEGGSAPKVDVTPRGSRRSIEFSLSVPNAAALSTLRETLRQDERVQMVF